jgi:hypothetical protein
MNPFKEKANELVDKFSVVGLQQRNEGLACALICVDEIIENYDTTLAYWQEVKKEIENL